MNHPRICFAVALMSIQAVLCAADAHSCRLTLRAVDPFGQEVRGLKVVSFLPYRSEGPDLGSRFQNGFAIVPHSTYSGEFRVDGRTVPFKESGIRVFQQRDVHYVVIGARERNTGRGKPLPWYGRVRPAPPGRRAWIKFTGVYLKGAASVETDESGHFAVSLESEGLYSVAVVWDYQVQHTGTIRVESSRTFLDIHVEDAGRRANDRAGKDK